MQRQLNFNRGSTNHLTSADYLHEHIDHVEANSPFKYHQKSNGTWAGHCPFCQVSPDSHEQQKFYITVRHNEVYLGCHRQKCGFGKSNNIFEFIVEREGCSFEDAFEDWCRYLGKWREPKAKHKGSCSHPLGRRHYRYPFHRYPDHWRKRLSIPK